MAGTNAIGTGAVILTANADRLAAGLDKAANDVGKFAQKAEAKAKAAGGKDGGGGLLGTMLGVAGGIGLAAVGGKVIGFVSGLFGDLQTRAAKVKLTPDVRGGVMVADRAVRQLSNTFDTVLLTAVAKIAPMIDRITPAVEAALYIAEGLFEAIVDVVGDVVEAIASWIDSTGALGVTTNDAGAVMFAVFKTVAKAVAYVWDTLKAGAGAIAYVAGTITEGFGIVVSVIGEAINMLAELAAELPEAIRPDWIKGAADAVKGWGNEIENAGDQMANWGKGAIKNWGTSAVQVGEWVDQIQKKFNNRVKVPMGGMDPPKLAGAFARESKEAYSIVAKYQVANGGPDTSEKRLLNATEAVKRAVLEVRDAVMSAGILRVAG